MAGPPETTSELDLASLLCLWLGRVTTPMMLFIGSVGLYMRAPALTLIGLAGLLVALSIWQTGRTGMGALRILPHLVVFEVIAAVAGATLNSANAGRTAPAVLLVMVGLFGTPRNATRFTALVVVLHILSMLFRSTVYPMPPAELVLGAISPAVMFGILGAVVVEITRRTRADKAALQSQLEEVHAVLPALVQVADGDLSQEVPGDGVLPEITRRMQAQLSELTSELRNNVEVLQSFAGLAGGNALAQQARTDRMAEVVHDVRDHQQRVLEQTRLSSEAAQRVARSSLASRSASADALESLDALAAAAKRVSTLHAAIKRLAAKSEVLAVNAAIEAHHAGQSGRAFATVAARMQELSEGIRSELAVAEALNIELAARAKDALKASTRAAESTLKSTQAADEIALHATDQLEATEQISEAFTEIEDFAESIRTETSQTRTHAAQVVIAADDLTRQMDRFRT